MPNPKKRKLSELSSSSREEQEDQKKVSRFEDDSCKRKRHKRTEDLKSPTRTTKEQKKYVKEDSNSPRHTQKSICRLPKTPAEEKKATSREKQHESTSSVSEHLHEKSYPKTEKKRTSSKHKTTSKCKTVEKEHLKPSSTRDAALASKAKKVLEERTYKTCPPSTSFKLEKLQMCPSVETVVQEDQKQKERKRNAAAEESSRTRHDDSSSKTKTPAPSSFKYSLKQESTEKIKNCCKSPHLKDSPAKCSLFTDAKDSSISDKKQSSSSAKHCTSKHSSKLWKEVPLTYERDKSVSPEPAEPSSSRKQILSQKFVPFYFRIPKKPKSISAQSTDGNDNSISAKINHGNIPVYEKKLPESEILKKTLELETVQPYSCLEGSFNSSYEQQDESPSSVKPLPSGGRNTQQCYNKEQVEELHLARSEKRLEVNVMQSCVDLTCMDTDCSEERPADTSCKQPCQQDIIVALDTNILLSHLDYVKKIKSCGLGAFGFPVILIPWVVLQELDSLKKGNGQVGSVTHLAIPAISYIYNALKNRDPHLCGQSMQQAAVSCNDLKTENNDDKVLQCCLQYQIMYPGCALILCTNDKNLCSKANLSGVRALCKCDLEEEVKKSRHGQSILQSFQAPVLPQIFTEVSSPVLGTSCTTVQSHGQKRDGPFVVVPDKGSKWLSEMDHKETKQKLSIILSELEECLQEVLSDILEVEMKAAYDNLWLEIVYLKPPWTLQDVLKCIRKHWIAVFGQIAPRWMSETVSNLITFFSSSVAVHSLATSKALQEAKELVNAFRKSSKHAPRAITVLNNIYNKLNSQSQHTVSEEEESSACDVIMKDEEEDKPLISAQVSPQEVWAMFEKLWSNMIQKRIDVFSSLGFDLHTMLMVTPMGGPAPPQDTVACLHKLSSVVSQLLQAFSRVLSSTPGSEEAQMLLTIIYSNTLVNEEPRLTGKDLIDCFSQPDYREKLRIGVNQLMEFKMTLDCCAQAAGQHTSFTTMLFKPGSD